MATVVLAMDQGRAQPTLVIWRDGKIAAFTWLQQVRPVVRVQSQWRDPAHQPWLRVEDAQGKVFLVGNRAGQWWALPWPPRRQPGTGTHAGPEATPSRRWRLAAGQSSHWAEPVRPEDYGAQRSRTGRKLPPVGNQRMVSRC